MSARSTRQPGSVQRCVRRETAIGLLFLVGLAVVAGATSVQTPGPGFQGNGPPRGGGNGPPPGPGRSPRSSPIEQLGRAIFADRNLSNPPGMACITCHAPEAGFTNGDSLVNLRFGSVPGINPSRFGSRKPMTISYAWFAPDGPTFWGRRQRAWAGGFFSDGRAATLQDQVGQPLVNPNEMDNVVHGLANTDGVVRKVASSSYAGLFREAFGDDALNKSSADVFRMVRQSVATYERSREVSPFSSKYDAVQQGEAQFTPSELNGLHLFTGSVTGRPGGGANARSARCIACHTIADAPDRHDFFTNWTYANIGVPRNPRNPYYKQTSKVADPLGYNPDGDKFVDLGLGAILYPARDLPPGNLGPNSTGRGDFLDANGTFRVPSLRNVDKRPSPNFAKCYMHNGVFKSLKDVVHFYNTRNLTTRGEVVDLTLAQPYVNTKGKPLWPTPEYPSANTLQNGEGDRNGRLGNLGLTSSEEDDIVAFLRTLSDGYFTPARRRPLPG